MFGYLEVIKYKILNPKIPLRIFIYFYNYCDISNIRRDDSDGMLIYNGNMSPFLFLEFEEVPKEFLYFKEISGNLIFSNCKNLKNIENLRNLRRVGSLRFENIPIESLKGLENLECINDINLGYCKNLMTFDGLNPFLKIVGDIFGKSVYPESKEQEFLQWQEQSRKNKQIREIVNIFSEV